VPRFSTKPSEEALEAKSNLLFDNLVSKRRPVFPEVTSLPVYDYKREILEAIADNQVIVVSAETGSGKTTQIPQFILDHAIEGRRGARCNILVTQPRRISAMSVALRVLDFFISRKHHARY